MKATSRWRGAWTDLFPGENLIQGARPEQVLIVDVGGGLVSRKPKLPIAAIISF